MAECDSNSAQRGNERFEKQHRWHGGWLYASPSEHLTKHKVALKHLEAVRNLISAHTADASSKL